MNFALKPYLLILTAALLFSSCTAVYINENHRAPGFVTEQIAGKSITLIATPQVAVREFVKTYYAAYPQDSLFTQDILLRLQNTLSPLQVGSTVLTNFQVDGAALQVNSLNAAEIEKASHVFEQINSDYIFNISNILVGNRVETSYAAGAGPGGASTQTSTEFCVVAFDVQIWDRNSKTKVLEFVTTGESSVSFFMFESALKDALDKAVIHASEFIKTGTTVFNK